MTSIPAMVKLQLLGGTDQISDLVKPTASVAAFRPCDLLTEIIRGNKQ